MARECSPTDEINVEIYGNHSVGSHTIGGREAIHSNARDLFLLLMLVGYEA
jgi:hypothetical protein